MLNEDSDFRRQLSRLFWACTSSEFVCCNSFDISLLEFMLVTVVREVFVTSHSRSKLTSGNGGKCFCAKVFNFGEVIFRQAIPVVPLEKR